MTTKTQKRVGSDSRRLISPPTNHKLGHLIWAFSIPALKTCPGATALCRLACYVTKGHFQFESNKEKYKQHWELSQSPDFVRMMIAELKRFDVRRLRIHVSGDFYSQAYIDKWIAIATGCPQIAFYAYTRSWRVQAMHSKLRILADLPNMQLWWSEDADSAGMSPRWTGVNTAFMMTQPSDEAMILPGHHDLIFRDRKLRGFRYGVVKRVNKVLVCPTEQWPIMRPQLRDQYREPPRFTCSGCRLCFSDTKVA